MANGHSAYRQESLDAHPFVNGDSTDYRAVLQNPAFLPKDKVKLRSRLRIWISALIISIVVFGLALGIQWTIYDRYLHEAGIRVVGSAIAACVSIVLVVSLGILERNQRVREIRRLETIALLNHHIRNALQAIVSSSGATNSTDTIRASVERIQWALGEVLPDIQSRNSRTRD
ncbi:MAG TPA: hypothetical protein VFU86_12460 [Terriglobales bacterium]|nr:hypothetical protein [Terriglobales bacterium]